MLLEIAGKAFQWPQVKWLHDHALNELEKMREEHEKGAQAEATPRIDPRTQPTVGESPPAGDAWSRNAAGGIGPDKPIEELHTDKLDPKNEFESTDRRV